MTSPADSSIADYVKSAAALLALPLSADQAVRVAVHFQRTAAMAALIQAVELPVHEELTEIYCPAAFTTNKYEGEQL